MGILKVNQLFRKPDYGANGGRARKPEKRSSFDQPLDDYKEESPRNHDLLDRSGNVVAEGLSEYEMVRELTEADESDGLFMPGSEKERYEVHFVNEQRELDVLVASRWLDQKICLYNSPGFSPHSDGSRSDTNQDSTMEFEDVHGEKPVSEQLSEEEHDRYVQAVMDNSYSELLDLFRKLSHSDPSVMYGLQYMLGKQETYFERGVKAYGGHFVTKLLEAYRAGDPDNREKIRSTWPQYWIKYVGMGISKSQQQ